MSSTFRERVKVALAPPSYLALPLAGIDLSTSGVKAVKLVKGSHGLILDRYSEVLLSSGAFSDGEIVDHKAVVDAIITATKEARISSAHVALPESKAYLFETSVQGVHKSEWLIATEQRLDELIPLPPAETDFDLIKVGQGIKNTTLVEGIGFARRIVEQTLSVFDEAGIETRSLEGETFAMARALLPQGDTSTVLIIDVGKTTTKLNIVTGRIPRFAATIGIGGHSLTLAVQKHFGVTETEARKVKLERGIVPAPGNEDYLAAMLSTVSAIKDEVSRRLEYWQDRAGKPGEHEKVSRAILAGGNASVRGLSEYLEGSLKIPVITGDVFTNFASRDTWIPQVDYTESLAYTTAIGLALRDHMEPYA